MKKYALIIFLLLLFISLNGCTNSKEVTIIDGTELIGEVILKDIIIEASKENGYISDNENIIFTVEELYEDDKGNTAAKIIKDFLVEIDNNNIATLEDNNNVIIKDNTNTGEELSVIVTYNDYKELYEYTIKKDLDSSIDVNNIILNPQSIDVLVNKNRSLPSDYIPADLVKLTVPTCLANPEVNQLREIAAEALGELFDGAKDAGYDLVARSGYRSYQTQKSLRNSIEKSKGITYADKYSAQPGESEHQTGLAIDITSPTVSNQLTKDFGVIPEGEWVRENAHLYGFIIRYPQGKEDIVGYEYEPWHLRYLGENLASKIYNSGLTMEEYFE